MILRDILTPQAVARHLTNSHIYLDKNSFHRYGLEKKLDPKESQRINVGEDASLPTIEQQESSTTSNFFDLTAPREVDIRESSSLFPKEQFENSGSLHFEVDAALLFQLGERLVARRSVALAELIKNAYDADATKVTVLFDNVTNSEGVIIVEDNGTGMTLEDIERSWMRIASNEKARKLVSDRFCRSLAGAKGVGRFASRRLSNKLSLSSVALRDDGSKEKIMVDFNWDEFEPGETLETIPVSYERESVSPDTPTGVTLYLEKIRDIWTQEDASELQQDLLSLTSPFVGKEEGVIAAPKRSGCEVDPGFSIEFLSEEFPKLSGKLDEKFLESAWGKLSGEVDDTGTPHYKLRIRGVDESESFTPNINKQQLFTKIIRARFTIYHVIYRKPFFTHIRVREASAYGREHGGVRIYLDNFRVFPYGDPSDDWLELDKIRASRHTTTPLFLQDEAKGLQRPILLIPGNNQLFGAVYISQIEHRDLQLTINRERLIGNEAFEQLKIFVQNGIFWLTVQYARWLAEEKSSAMSLERPKVISDLERLEQVVTISSGVDQTVKTELMEIISLAKQAAELREEELISEVSMLRVLASAGTMIIIFGHQLRAIIDGLETINVDLERLRNQLPEIVYPTYDNILEQLEDWRTTVEAQAKQIGLLAGADARQRKRRLVVHEVIDRATSPLRSYTKRYQIDVKNEVPDHLRTPPMFEAEFHAIIINIFTNALKAVREESVRRILITAEQQASGLYIRMSDTGIGLEQDKREQVFQPFYSTSGPLDTLISISPGVVYCTIG